MELREYQKRDIEDIKRRFEPKPPEPVKTHPFRFMEIYTHMSAGTETYMPKRVAAFIRREIGRKNVAIAFNPKTLMLITKEF